MPKGESNGPFRACQAPQRGNCRRRLATNDEAHGLQPVGLGPTDIRRPYLFAGAASARRITTFFHARCGPAVASEQTTRMPSPFSRRIAPPNWTSRAARSVLSWSNRATRYFLSNWPGSTG